MKTLMMIVLCLFGLAAHAQERVLVYPVTAEGNRPTLVYSYQNLKNGFELWGYRQNDKEFGEVISPQLRLGREGYLIKMGAYLRFTDQALQRAGVAGSLAYGSAKGWQLTGPYYVFGDLTGKQAELGALLPNLRLTYPVSKDLRLGVGTGVLLIDGKRPSITVGPFLQARLSSSLTLQLRPGVYLSPQPQAGRLQLFAGLLWRWK